jgi:hypothetical protein
VLYELTITISTTLRLPEWQCSAAVRNIGNPTNSWAACFLNDMSDNTGSSVISSEIDVGFHDHDPENDSALISRLFSDFYKSYRRRRRVTQPSRTAR